MDKNDPPSLSTDIQKPDKTVKTNESFVDVRETLPVAPNKSTVTEEFLKERLEDLKRRVRDQEYLTPQPTEAEREILENMRIERMRKISAGTSNTRDYATIQFTPKQISYLVNLLQRQSDLSSSSVGEECLVKLESARIRM